MSLAEMKQITESSSLSVWQEYHSLGVVMLGIQHTEFNLKMPCLLILVTNWTDKQIGESILDC